MQSKIFASLAFCFQMLTMSAVSQNFLLMRYDENYEYLKDSVQNFYNKLKFYPLSKNKKMYASFGGEARLEFVSMYNETWGKTNTGHDDFYLQRYDFYGDIHIGNRFRVFAQLRSALENGRENGPRPIDEDKLNVQNLFADAIVWTKAPNSLTLRIGKQEIDYGSSRLISVRDGPNVRLYFTGAKVMFASASFFADAFVMKADTINPGVLDNKTSKNVNLWGVYSSRMISEIANLDVFYIGIYRQNSVFEEGTANETRHTIGFRFFKNVGGFTYDVEGTYQFGKFGNGNISASAAAIDIGYQIPNVKFKPSINLRSDYISGDRKKGDGQLGSFNPIYPQGGYFGFDPQIGSVNLLALHPYATFLLLPNLVLQTDIVISWRQSLQDGIYRPSGTFYMAGSSSSNRHIGNAYLATAVYSFNRFISLNTGIQYFKTGSFIHDIIPNSKNGVFFDSRIKFMF
jgi:Alginate export